jgi:hypothetical protein
MSSDSLPKKTFARKIVTFQGYSRDQAINDIAYVDGVDQDEAARRHDVAIAQRTRRSVGQTIRQRNVRNAITAARNFVLLIAQANGLFACPGDLAAISDRAGWGDEIGPDTTGRAYREFVLQLEREGLLAEKRNEDDRLIGYTLTDAGVQYLEQSE